MKKKLNLSPKERRLYENAMHRKQEARRKEKKVEESYKIIVQKIHSVIEQQTTNNKAKPLDDESLQNVVDSLIEEDCFKIVLGSKKIGVKVNE